MVKKITPEMVEAAGKIIYGKEFTGDSQVIRDALAAAFAAEPKGPLVVITKPAPVSPVIITYKCRGTHGC